KIEEPKPPNACFRVVPADGGKHTLTVDTPEPEDTEYEREGVTVLVVSEEIRARCEGRTLDSDDTGNLVLM
ncbi:MAG: hypothetical protein ACE5FP_05235, partial [Gemmatimonadota bacterium]